MESEIKYILEGRWDSAHWAFAMTEWMPNTGNITAVFGVPIHPEGLVMTKSHRGWELPGGHREKDETTQEALARELLEEGGVRIFTSSEKPIAHLKIVDDKPKMNKATGELYPDPSYVIFFAVNTSHPIEKHTGEEIEDNRIFAFDDLPEGTPLGKLYLKYLLEASKNHEINK